MVKINEGKRLKDITVIGRKDQLTIETFLQSAIIRICFNKKDLEFLRQEIDEWLVCQYDLETHAMKIEKTA